MSRPRKKLRFRAWAFASCVGWASQGVGSRTPCAAKNLSLVRGPRVVQLTKKPRAEASGVVVDSDLKIESKRTTSGAGRLSVDDSARISGLRIFFPEGLELCHRSHDRFPKVMLSSSSACTMPLTLSRDRASASFHPR